MERIGRGGALVVGLVGAMVLVGWYAGVAPLMSALPGQASMKPNTAVGLLALGGVTLLEYLFGRSLGIDMLPGIDFGSDAPRMAKATAVSFVLLGSALIAAARGRTRLMRGFALAALCVAQIAILGHAYGVSSLYSIAGATSMAIHTALSLAVLSLGILLLDPSAGLASLFRDRGGAGRLVRVMVPFVCLGAFAAARDVTDQNQARRKIAHQQATALTRLAELEQWHRLTVGRELKMIELKKENEYLRKFGSTEGGEQSGAY